MKIIRKMRNSQKWEKISFSKKLQNNGHYWTSRSLFNLQMNINLNICPSEMQKIQISDPKNILIENEILLFIHGYFALSRCKKIKAPVKEINPKKMAFKSRKIHSQ